MEFLALLPLQEVEIEEYDLDTSDWYLWVDISDNLKLEGVIEGSDRLSEHHGPAVCP